VTTSPRFDSYSRTAAHQESRTNAKFDAKFIKHNFGVDLGGLFDTLLASQLVSAGRYRRASRPGSDPPDAI
jgi:hypothetical protein